MTKRVIILIALIALSIMMTGCNLILENIGHDHIYSEWYETVEPTCSEAGTEKRYCLLCFSEEYRDVLPLDHIRVYEEAKDADCINDGHTEGWKCGECDAVLSGMFTISSTGHNEVIDPAIEPTASTPGKTEGRHCAVCGEIIIKQEIVILGDYSNTALYDGVYAFDSLAGEKNGGKMQAFYNAIDSYADDFHISAENAKTSIIQDNKVYYAAEIYFDDFGLSYDEAIAAWNAYRIDHPLYYWISNSISYTDRYILLHVNEEHSDGEVRSKYNDLIYSTVQSYIELVSKETDDYYITLALHDLIITSADYAYESDGVTPSLENSAHSIIGVLLEGEGVCESYTKSFQLLLNFLRIENIFVLGWSGEFHSWNLVKVNGDWYWYDLTWDDAGDMGLGIRYNYFCVNDIQNVNCYDGKPVGEYYNFLDDHTPSEAGDSGIGYFYALPDRADNVYSSGDIMLRKGEIVVDGNSYVINGYNTVCLTKIRAEGDIIVPESIKYKGREYTVVAIGGFENGVFLSGNILYYVPLIYKSFITSIHIPSTVRFIWDYAFDGSNTIQSFGVDEDSEYFTSRDGVLFTKSLYTLIKYPLAARATSYTTPDETVEIAFNAFGDGGNIFCPKYLRTLIIGKNVQIVGACNFGLGFRDGIPSSGSDVLYLPEYWDRLYNMLTVNIDSKNEYFS